MSAIGSIQLGSCAPVSGPATGNAASPTDPLALLPAPMELPADPLLALLTMQSKSRSLQMDSGVKDVLNNKRLRAKAFAEFKKAMKKARDARKKGGFWKSAAKLCSKLGKYGSVVAAVAVAVGTGGVGAPASLAIVGAALSSASLLQSEAKLLQQLGMSDELAAKLEVGMGIGGAAFTGGASGLASADATVEAVQQGVAATTGAATVAGGAATAVAGHYEGVAGEREADALAARVQEEHLMRVFDQIVEDLEASESAERRSIELLRGAIETRGATPLIVAGKV